MGQLRSASQAVLLRAPGPAEALTDLDTFASRIPGAECTTVFCAIIDPGGRDGHLQLRRAPAAHPRHGRRRMVTCSTRPSPCRWPCCPLTGGASQATATLPPGATLMLYTDGLVERRNQPLDKGIDAAAVTVAGRRAGPSGRPGRPRHVGHDAGGGLRGRRGRPDLPAPACPADVQVTSRRPLLPGLAPGRAARSGCRRPASAAGKPPTS